MPPKILPPEGIQVLRDSLDSGNINLSKSQRADLLQKIHDMGHTWYTEDALNDWFHSARKTRESDITIEKSTGSPDLSRTKPVIKLGRGRPKNERLSQYPSIRLVHLSNLQVLASASPNPSQEVIKIWADLTGSDPIDVANWVRNYHPSQEETDYRATTDQDFLDVEDVEEEVSEEEEEEKEEPLSQKSASQINPAPYRNLAHYPPPSPQPVDSGVQLSPQENLLLAISKSLSLSSEEPPLPRSSLQFNDLFAPYETMMKYLIENQDWQS